MPVPLSVMQAAAQGDKKAMRLVEQEYGVGDGQNYAIDYLSEEEPPPRVPTGVIGIEHPTRYESRYQYSYDGKKQVREAEAKALAEKISRLKKQSDIQDVLLKVAAEDAELAEETGRQLMVGGGALLGTAAALVPVGRMAIPYHKKYGMDLSGGSLLGTMVAGGTAEGALIGGAASDILRTGEIVSNQAGLKKEKEARERMQSIELSPEAQKIYDEYKAKGYSPTYYKTK